MLAGFYPSEEIPMASYLADPCPVPSLSSGAAHRLLVRSPAHVYAQHPRMGAQRQEDNDASDMGTIAHDLILGGEGKICVIDPELYRSKPTKDNPDGSIPAGWTNSAIRAARDLARSNDLIPILPGAMAGAKAMEKAARAFLAGSELAGVLDDGEGEVTMLWQEGDIWLRARPDWLNHKMKVCLHLKTTKASAKPESFIRMSDAMGYDVSIAFYKRGFEALTKQRDFLHVILAVEQDAPCGCSLIGLGPAKMEIAEMKINRSIGIWRECMATGVWPGYSNQIHYADPSAWQIAEAEALIET